MLGRFRNFNIYLRDSKLDKYKNKPDTFLMSIRITNNNSGRTYIIKNQDDIQHLKTGVTSLDSDDDDLKLFGDEDDYSFDEPFAGTPDASSSLANRRAYKNYNSEDDYTNLDDFDGGPAKHYIDATAYHLSDEKASWHDPSTVDAPINKLITPDIPDDQTTDVQLDNTGFNLDDTGDEGFDFSLGDETDQDGFSMDDEDGEGGDPDFQGTIRTVRGACLVYKRKTENGTYEELWIYNVGDNIKQETAVRKAILAGTDIDPNTHASDDGEQKAKTVTIGNVQYLNITGMVQ